MDFKSTENLLRSQERTAKSKPLVRMQTFDVSSSSSTHSHKQQGRKIVVENVQVHQSPETAPVPRNRSAFNPPHQVLKTAKDNANELIQMSTFSTSIDEPEVVPVPVKDMTKRPQMFELEEFSDISSISSRHSRIRGKVQVKSDKSSKKKVESPEMDAGSFVVHKSGIWGDIPTVATTDDPAQKLSEYEKENDESLKEKSTSVKVVHEKSPLKQIMSKVLKPKSKAPKVRAMKSESSQTLYRSSITTNTTGSESSSDELPVSKKKQKGVQSDTSYSSSDTKANSEESKGSSVEEALAEQDDISDRKDQILGVYVHHTTDLKFDIHIRDPRVRVSIVDERTGGLAIYHQQTIKAKQIEQPFILPMTTKQCDFISQM